MSTQATAYALDQKLPVSEHLALIIISDALPDTFLLEDAVDIIQRRTLIVPSDAESIVKSLMHQGHIVRWFGGETLCVPLLDYPEFPQLATKSASPKLSSGYVYLIQSPTGAYKIGRSSNPESRFTTFQLTLPFEIYYICVIKTEDMKGLEASLHERFSNRRINGEWFKLTDEDVEYIKGLANG